jgi:hypothetical protein
MYDREFSASLIIASKGPAQAEVRSTAYGEMRSRDGADLRYTSNDAKGMYSNWLENQNLPSEAFIYLENPTKSVVEEAVNQINGVLSNYPQEKSGIDLFFAGHGHPRSGSLVLKDGNLSAKELIDLISRPLEKTKGRRGLSFFLDSCYSGGFLIDTIIELEKDDSTLRLFDALVSSMYDEKSWELSFLEHGAFTFSFLNKGNAYVDRLEFARAVEKNDSRIIAKYLQSMVGTMGGDSATFLTQGKQHSIDCIKGHHFTIGGFGNFSLTELEEEISREILEERFKMARSEIWNNN